MRFLLWSRFCGVCLSYSMRSWFCSWCGALLLHFDFPYLRLSSVLVARCSLASVLRYQSRAPTWKVFCRSWAARMAGTFDSCNGVFGVWCDSFFVNAPGVPWVCGIVRSWYIVWVCSIFLLWFYYLLVAAIYVRAADLYLCYDIVL